jgi:hypothetical protein
MVLIYARQGSKNFIYNHDTVQLIIHLFNKNKLDIFYETTLCLE